MMQVHLFIFSFRGITMNIFKRIFAGIMAVAIFLAVADFWKYMLIDDSSSYTRIMLHQLYNSEKNIDVLFVGSSHAYRAFVPEITDSEFGLYTFNAGTSSQFMDGSYALIEEAGKKNKLKNVYLEMFYGMADNMPYKDRDSLTATYIISDYMRPSFNKLRYLLCASSKEYWINSFLIAKRNWNRFFDSNYIMEVIASKQTENYKNYIYQKNDGDEEYYVDRGYVACSTEVCPETLFNCQAYGKIGVGTNISCDSDWYRSLTDIVNYCKKNDIQLTLFIAPEPEWTLVGKENYQEYHEFISDIAQKYSLDFLDFNLCKREYFDTKDYSLFKDEDHLNDKGARQFSTLIGELFAGKLSQEKVFFESYNEKIEEEGKIFYGIAGPLIDEEGNRECKIITGSSDYEFQVIETSDDGIQTILKDFSKELDFIIPCNESGIMTIVCKNADNVETYEFDFCK